MRRLAGGIAVALFASTAAAGGGRLYDLPAAGSYELPVIDRVSRHELIDASGEPAFVLGAERAECSVVSFVYSVCPDAQGCPLILATLRRLDRALSANPALSKRVRLVTVSFDPARDTPAQLRMLRDHLDPIGDWRFLTARSQAELRPVLEDYGQDVLRLVALETGEPTARIRHVSKVFLVDASGGVRNVYSSGFLDEEILLRDIETLIGADAPARQLGKDR